jgi:Peptidase family M49
MRRLLLLLALCALLANGCTTTSQVQPAVALPTSPVGMPTETDKLPIAPDTPRRATQLPRTVIDYDHALLTDSERQVVAKLIEASRQIDEIFLRQVSEDNPSMRGRLANQAAAPTATPLDRAGYDYFIINKGPWDRLAEDQPFVGTAKKPAGAAFYPGDITKSELEQYVAKNPRKKEELEGLFTVVRHDGTDFAGVPYHSVYRDHLEQAAKSLREAATLTDNASLKSYLTKRADAFLSDDYRDSDMAWMDLNGPIEVVIGPYEVYEDNLFNYKAAYEAFVTVVDAPETAKLAAYARALPDMERNLPEPEQYKNMSRGTESPIRVVQEVYTAGDARHSVQTAAFNLPNDEVVREKKGSKKVLLKNVMDAKFRQSGKPIALRVLDPSLVNDLSFDAYFNHTLFHELSHGLGPGFVTLPGGERVEARKPLKELFSTIEECKADVLGVWNLEYAQSHNLVTSFNERQLFATYAGLMFRTLRFGTGDAHGRGMAVQWNWLRERGAIVPAGTKFTVDFAKMRDGVKALATELLTIEATGDYNRATALLAKYGKATPEMDAVNRGLADIPVDFTPVFPAAGEK